MKTKYSCTACAATDDKPAMIDHCAAASQRDGTPHAIAGLKTQPKQITAAHEREAARAAVRDAITAKLGIPADVVADALRGA